MFFEKVCTRLDNQDFNFVNILIKVILIQSLIRLKTNISIQNGAPLTLSELYYVASFVKINNTSIRNIATEQHFERHNTALHFISTKRDIDRHIHHGTTKNYISDRNNYTRLSLFFHGQRYGGFETNFSVRTKNIIFSD